MTNEKDATAADVSAKTAYPENPRKSLKERAKELALVHPLMDGRTKGDTDGLLDKVITIKEYGFIPKPEGGGFYAIFVTAEEPKVFFFAGKVLTDTLARLDAEGYTADIARDGLSIRLSEKKAKESKRDYTAVEIL
jgi:hypothetical protein